MCIVLPIPSFLEKLSQLILETQSMAACSHSSASGSNPDRVQSKNKISLDRQDDSGAIHRRPLRRMSVFRICSNCPFPDIPRGCPYEEQTATSRTSRSFYSLNGKKFTSGWFLTLVSAGSTTIPTAIFRPSPVLSFPNASRDNILKQAISISYPHLQL